MRIFSVLIAIFIALIILSCSSPTESEKSPQLIVNPVSFSFSRQTNTDTLIISNGGEQELSWEILNKPDWIQSSKNNGTIVSGEDLVILDADISKDVGTYSGMINLSSNGGNKGVSVILNIEPRGLIGKWNLFTGSRNGDVLENLSGFYNFQENKLYSARIEKDSNRGSISGRSYMKTGSSNGTIKFDSPAQILLNGIAGGTTIGPDGTSNFWSTNISFSQTAFSQYGGTGLGWPPTESFKFNIIGDTLTISKADDSTILKYLAEE